MPVFIIAAEKISVLETVGMAKIFVHRSLSLSISLYLVHRSLSLSISLYLVHKFLSISVYIFRFLSISICIFLFLSPRLWAWPRVSYTGVYLSLIN